MADGAHLEILATHPGGVKARTVRIETSSSLGGVTGEAIAFGVATYAGLETLPRRPAMPRHKELFGVMIPRTQPPGGDQARLGVTRGAEAPLAVTIAA
jgi:hypothetical protein